MISYRPLIAAFIFFCLGILSGYWFHLPFYGWGMGAGLLLMIWCACRRAGPSAFFFKKIVRLIALFFLGAFYFSLRQGLAVHDLESLRYWERQKPVFISGTIVSDVSRPQPSGRQKTTLILNVRSIEIDGQKRDIRDKILVQVFRDLDADYGDELRIQGRLHRPFSISSDGHLSYRTYLNRKGIRFILSAGKKSLVQRLSGGHGTPVKAAAFTVKKCLKKILNHYLDPPSAGIINALILGERYDIPKKVKELFVLTGTAHILAISGFNVGIVASFLFWFFKALRVPRSARYLLAIFSLIFYAFMTGGQPPVIRATIMSVVFLSSFLIERESDPFNILACSGWLILLYEPLNLLDVGFQLSFVSVLFILLLYKEILNAFAGAGKVLSFLRQSLAVSVAAWTGVAGLVCYYFAIVTPVTILANLVIVPLVSVLVGLGLGLLLAGLVFAPAALLISKAVKILLFILFKATFLFAQIPGAYFYMRDVSFWKTATYYLFIGSTIAAYFYKKRKKLKSLDS